nr:hypothetical protein [Streptomyces tailanensis]
MRRWRAVWRQGGAVALASVGPMSVERLSPPGSGGVWRRS